MAKKKTAAENMDAAQPHPEKAQGSPLCDRQGRPRRQGDRLVEKLKPKYVQPPPKEPQFNYIIDVWTSGLAAPCTSARPTPVLAQRDLALVRDEVRPHGTFGRAVALPSLTCGIPRNGSGWFPAPRWTSAWNKSRTGFGFSLD